jgi:phage terminase small subunit
MGREKEGKGKRKTHVCAREKKKGGREGGREEGRKGGREEGRKRERQRQRETERQRTRTPKCLDYVGKSLWRKVGNGMYAK